MRAVLTIVLMLAASPALAEDIVTPRAVQSVSPDQMRDPHVSPPAHIRAAMKAAQAFADEDAKANADYLAKINAGKVFTIGDLHGAPETMVVTKGEWSIRR